MAGPTRHSFPVANATIRKPLLELFDSHFEGGFERIVHFSRIHLACSAANQDKHFKSWSRMKSLNVPKTNRQNATERCAHMMVAEIEGETESGNSTFAKAVM